MAYLNKNNLKVKLADGLTEIGMSQVRSEIGGGSNNIELLVNDEDLLINPNTKEPYANDITKEDLATVEQVKVIIQQIVEDYDLAYTDMKDDDSVYGAYGLVYYEDRYIDKVLVHYETSLTGETLAFKQKAIQTIGSIDPLKYPLSANAFVISFVDSGYKILGFSSFVNEEIAIEICRVGGEE